MVGQFRFGSSSETILDGVSVVVPEKVAASTAAVAIDRVLGQPVPRLLVLRSQLIGGIVAILNTGIPVQIENSILTQRDDPTCRVYDHDGVIETC